MTNRRRPQKSVAIFSGSLWPQRHLWRSVELPANTCLLAVDRENEKQTQLMRRLAKSFKKKGRPILIWFSSTQSSQYE